MLSVLEIRPRAFRNRSSMVLRNKIGVIVMIFSFVIALIPGLRASGLLREVDLKWILTLPKKPRYQTRCVSFTVLRKPALELGDGVCNLCDTDLIGADARDGSSIVVLRRPAELEILM